MQKVGFARVSTNNQELQLQLDALSIAGCDEIFHGKQSGDSKENDQKLSELISYVRKDDVVYVTKLDRLARSLKAVLSAIEAIHSKGATLKSLDGVIDTSNKSPFAQATINLIGTFAQLERDLIVSRTAEGREFAKAQGKKFGRKYTIEPDDRKLIKSELKAGKSKSALAKEYGVSRTTIKRIEEE